MKKQAEQIEITDDNVSKIVKDSVTAIYNAIKANNINLVETLLTNLRVDPNIEFNKYGDNNFLKIACNMSNKEMAKLLFEKGANPISGFYKLVRLYEAVEEIGLSILKVY